MNEPWRTSEQVTDLFAALALAQGELSNIDKDAVNPHFKAKYATLAAVLDGVRATFAKHGISIMQMPVNGEATNIGVVTRLGHSSGQWVESVMFVAPTKYDAQGAGSVISYLRRYSLMAMAGVAADDDDDANAAVGRPERGGQTNGVTRAANSPPPPAPIAHLNPASLPPGPEETAEVTAARQRVKLLISKYTGIIKTAPTRNALELSFDDGREELAEIEAAGENGKNAAIQLRDRYMRRITEFREGKAA